MGVVSEGIARGRDASMGSEGRRGRTKMLRVSVAWDKHDRNVTKKGGDEGSQRPGGQSRASHVLLAVGRPSRWDRISQLMSS